MVLKIYFDASFLVQSKEAGVSIIIKNEYGKLILKSSKKIKCNNNIEAEFRALNKAVGYINNKQLNNLIAKGCLIEIHGDCLSVIETSKKLQIIKGVEKCQMIGFLKELRILKSNNKVVFKWIRRNKNVEAHKESRAKLNLN